VTIIRQRGEIPRGLPTGYAAPPLSEHDIPLFDDVDSLRWTGATPAFAALAARFDAATVDKTTRRGKR
jgi:hypothetical protein